MAIKYEDVTIVNIYTPNARVQKLTDLKGGIYSTTIMGGYNTQITEVHRSTGQKGKQYS